MKESRNTTGASDGLERKEKQIMEEIETLHEIEEKFDCSDLYTVN